MTTKPNPPRNLDQVIRDATTVLANIAIKPNPTKETR